MSDEERAFLKALASAVADWPDPEDDPELVRAAKALLKLPGYQRSASVLEPDTPKEQT